MLGPPKPRRLDEPIAVSLEDHLPRDHFDRHRKAKRDLRFVREWTRDLYAERGRPSIEQVVFFTRPALPSLETTCPQASCLWSEAWLN